MASIGPELRFLAVRALNEVFIWSNKTNAAVDTTAVTDRLKSSKRLNVFLDHF